MRHHSPQRSTSFGGQLTVSGRELRDTCQPVDHTGDELATVKCPESCRYRAVGNPVALPT
jgi:hypothetical protein